MGRARVLRTALGILSGNYLLGVSPAALADPVQRANIIDYTARVKRTYEWVETNKPAWKAALAQATQVKPAYIGDEIDHQSQPTRIAPLNDQVVASAQSVADTFAKVGLLPAGVNVRPYFEFGIIG